MPTSWVDAVPWGGGRAFAAICIPLWTRVLQLGDDLPDLVLIIFPSTVLQKIEFFFLTFLWVPFILETVESLLGNILWVDGVWAKASDELLDLVDLIGLGLLVPELSRLVQAPNLVLQHIVYLAKHLALGLSLLVLDRLIVGGDISIASISNLLDELHQRLLRGTLLSLLLCVHYLL